jgi:uncharacterized protein
MKQADVIQERIRFGRGGRLAGVLHYPAETRPRRAVLLCSPHPDFAGDMDNNVILSLAERLANDCVALRFDYRGVGESRIDLPPGVSALDYWEEVEQTRNYTDALADCADAADQLSQISGGLPMAAIGYSFGAATATRTALADPRFDAMVGISPPFKRIAFEFLADCPKPCLMLSGQDDFVFDPHVAARLSAAAGVRLTMEILDGMDHFFRGTENVLGQRVADFVLGFDAPRPGA